MLTGSWSTSKYLETTMCTLSEPLHAISFSLFSASACIRYGRRDAIGDNAGTAVLDNTAIALNPGVRSGQDSGVEALDDTE